MKTTKTLAEMAAEHPEFVYLGKTYRCSAASGDWLYLDNRNQWRVVPKTWTHILRELPVMEDMERRANAQRTMEETKPASLKVAIVGGGVGSGAILAAAVGLLKAAHMEVDHVADAMAYRQQYPHQVRTFPQSLLAPLRWGPIPGKQPKKTGSKIEQRFMKARAKANGYRNADEWTAGAEKQDGERRMHGTPDVRKNRRTSIRLSYRVIAEARARHRKSGASKRFATPWVEAVRIITRAIKYEKFGSWPMKTAKI